MLYIKFYFFIEIIYLFFCYIVFKRNVVKKFIKKFIKNKKKFYGRTGFSFAIFKININPNISMTVSTDNA
jgi:hypothetical protein